MGADPSRPSSHRSETPIMSSTMQCADIVRGGYADLEIPFCMRCKSGYSIIHQDSALVAPCFLAIYSIAAL
jgi:hypothetical protein